MSFIPSFHMSFSLPVTAQLQQSVAVRQFQAMTATYKEPGRSAWLVQGPQSRWPWQLQLQHLGRSEHPSRAAPNHVYSRFFSCRWDQLVDLDLLVLKLPLEYGIFEGQSITVRSLDKSIDTPVSRPRSQPSTYGRCNYTRWWVLQY